MRGPDLKDWRKRQGFSQDDLMRELGISSRQTISTWENSDKELSRMLELALIALEEFPECRNWVGKKATADERKRMKNLRLE